MVSKLIFFFVYIKKNNIRNNFNFLMLNLRVKIPEKILTFYFILLQSKIIVKVDDITIITVILSK